MAEAPVANARPSRERKVTQRLEPEKAKENKGFNYVPASGTPLGDIPYFRNASDKLGGDDDVLIMLHTLFFGSAGKNTMRKRQLRLFAGFPEDSPSRASLVEKISNSKKWTVTMLKTAAGLFGLEKGGSRDEIIERFVDFVISPSELKDVPAAKTKKITKKRKAAAGSKKAKGDKPKRAASPYLLFCMASRSAIKTAHPDASFGEITKHLGAAWQALDETAKGVWVAAAAAAAAVVEANGVEGGGKKQKKRKTEVSAAEESEEEGDEEEEEEEEKEEEEEEGGTPRDFYEGEEEEEAEERDKDLFPDSDDEA